MVCPSTATLHEENIRQIENLIDLLKEKFDKCNDYDLIVCHCIHVYSKIENKIEEIRKVSDVIPLNQEEANSLLKEINYIKDLPNAEIKSIKTFILEEIQRKQVILNQLYKIF
jgi:methyl coenzyme M reductase subunit C-like uncharacterized protein (methanogenesis marker protein 7)